MKISVIIPVYNVEKYLRRCIQSVIEQTYNDLEIILVDDGSNDKSGVMCDEYSLQDSRIIVIHKKNGGLSSARNVGIEVAKGDAIFFLDSDDYISVDCLKNMSSLMEVENADIAIIQMKYIGEDVNEEFNDTIANKIVVMNAEKAIEESLYQRMYSCCAPAKLYKKEVIGDIRFPLGRVSEDLATCHLLINNAKKIVYSSYWGYYYRQHNSSIMHVFNPKRMDALEWAQSIEKFCNKEYPNILGAAYCRTFNVAIHLLLDLPKGGQVHDRYYNIIWKEIKRTRVKTLWDKKVRKREKVAALLTFGGEGLLRKIWESKVAVRKD